MGLSSTVSHLTGLFKGNPESLPWVTGWGLFVAGLWIRFGQPSILNSPVQVFLKILDPFLDDFKGTRGNNQPGGGWYPFAAKDTQLSVVPNSTFLVFRTGNWN